MKKLLQGLAAVVLVMSFAPSVSAAELACTITNPGPGSDNLCRIDSRTDIALKCDAKIKVVNTNGQETETGGADVDGNTNGGGATTGSAVNFNGVRTTIGAACPAVCPACPPTDGGNSTTPPAPNPTPNPTPTPPAVGGMGGGPQVGSAATTKPAPSAAGVAVLPQTGSNDVLVNVAGATVALGATAGIAQLAIAGYRRRALN